MFDVHLVQQKILQAQQGPDGGEGAYAGAMPGSGIPAIDAIIAIGAVVLVMIIWIEGRRQERSWRKPLSRPPDAEQPAQPPRTPD